MKKILLFLLIFMFFSSYVSAEKCRNATFAYFDNHEHYYNNIDLCDENYNEKVTSFWTLSYTLTHKSHDWDWNEKTYLFSILWEKNWVNRARILLDWKLLLQLFYENDSLIPISSYSTSWKHVFTFIWPVEWWVEYREKDNDVLWVYLDWKKIFDWFDWPKGWREFFMKNYGFLIWRENTSDIWFSEDELRKLDAAVEKIKKYDEKRKWKIISKLRDILFELNKTILNPTKSDYKKFLIANYLQQEIAIDMILNNKKS